MITKQGNVWGESSPLFSKNNVEVHRILARRDGRSSRHRHAHKFNLFYVESGCLRVVIEQPYNLADITFVRKHESCVVAPGLWHRFEAMEATLAFEIFWTELDPADIERDGHGGMNGYERPTVSEGSTEVREGS